MRSRRGYRADAHIGGAFVIAAAVLASLLASGTARARDADARILHFEPLDRGALTSSITTLRKPQDGGQRQLQFDAYGRRFVLNVQTNDALSAGRAPAQSKLRASGLRLYQGRIDGDTRSWVRLALKGEELHGMLWDGAAMYVIEPAADVLDALVPPLADPSSTVMFRLADVVLDPTAAACASQATPASRGDAALDALMLELKGSPALMQSVGASRELEVSVVGDAAFLRNHADVQDAHDAILVRLNNVDGIFSAQLGIRIRVAGVYVKDAASDRLSGTTAAGTLLAELGRLRRSSPELNSRGLTHLFTGRDLDGTTVGMAYVDALCQVEQGVGLTQAQSTWRDSLVAAHELGHNFGADHDGDASGSCASAPPGFLMAPAVSGSDQFSQCSIDRMRPRAQIAKCITALAPADLSILRDLGTVRRPLADSFAWALQVSNSGGLSATNARAELLVPPALKIEDAYVEGGSCTSGAGVIQCLLGDVAGGASRTVHLVLRSDEPGSSSISARIAADNDAWNANDSGDGTIVIEPEADVGVSLQGPDAARTTDAFVLGYTVASQAAVSATDVLLTITTPAGVTAAEPTLANGSCTVEGATVRCTLASLAPGASAAGAVRLSAPIAGNLTVRASISGSYVDSNSANDLAHVTIAVAGVAQAAEQKSPGSGGGGSMNVAFLLAFAGLAGLLRRRR